ncbi:hypothetical protein [Streptomyces sp. NPDC047070]
MFVIVEVVNNAGRTVRVSLHEDSEQLQQLRIREKRGEVQSVTIVDPAAE